MPSTARIAPKLFASDSSRSNAAIRLAFPLDLLPETRTEQTSPETG